MKSTATFATRFIAVVLFLFLPIITVNVQAQTGTIAASEGDKTGIFDRVLCKHLPYLVPAGW
jgi:hypothetical protein